MEPVFRPASTSLIPGHDAQLRIHPPLAHPPFLVVEGLDGTGKSTVSRLLATSLGAEWLSTPMAELATQRPLIEQAFSGSAQGLRLFYAATVQAASDRARLNRQAGRGTVVDRYWLSTVTYAEVAGETDLPFAALGANLLVPDLTVFLVAPLAVRQERMTRRGKLTAADRRTLDPREEQRLLATYDKHAASFCGARRAVLDVGDLEPAGVVEAIRRRMES
ncbi:MAG: AAA family ATPase [Myxococcota bacterium]|jgi:thymidylate kinase|nr:AAA family ATPase [Myxococcota bacterium]